MDSTQSVVSPFKSSDVFSELEKRTSNIFDSSSPISSSGIELQRKEAAGSNFEGSLAILEVYIHQARDIHNICIYRKQDVYAKLCLTSDPENTVSTQIVHGGGKNPVFNENLCLNVRKIESSLKCEIWNVSRVNYYVEDQMMSFLFVPLSEVLVRNGKLAKEFSLSSTDLFHSPAGFVELSLSYVGASPELLVIPTLPKSVSTDPTNQDIEVSKSVPNEFDSIEFPDPKIVNENNMMVSEYFGIPCTDLDSSQSSDSLVSSETETHPSSDVCAPPIDSFSAGITNLVKHSKLDSTHTSVSTNGSPVSLPASSQSSANHASKSPNQEYVSPPQETPKENASDVGDAESDASGGLPSNTIAKPMLTVNVEPEQKVVQQDIVDMYMKSMQQFTESLAKMKLPLDIDSKTTSSGNSSSDHKSQPSKSIGSRVFYGSRAFF